MKLLIAILAAGGIALSARANTTDPTDDHWVNLTIQNGILTESSDLFPSFHWHQGDPSGGWTTGITAFALGSTFEGHFSPYQLTWLIPGGYIIVLTDTIGIVSSASPPQSSVPNGSAWPDLIDIYSPPPGGLATVTLYDFDVGDGASTAALLGLAMLALVGAPLRRRTL